MLPAQPQDLTRIVAAEPGLIGGRRGRGTAETVEEEIDGSTSGRFGGGEAMSRLMLKSAKRASLIENLRSLRGLGKMRVR